VGLGDSLDDAICGLTGRSVQDGEGVLRGYFFASSLSVENEGYAPAACVMESRKEADEFLAGGRGSSRVLGAQIGPGVEDAVPVNKKVAGCVVQRGPRSWVHPAAGLGVLAAALALIFLRFR
jgi:hypothetical protein